jgi:hypothetical protein
MFLRFSKINPSVDRSGIKFSNTAEVAFLRMELNKCGAVFDGTNLYNELRRCYHVDFSADDFIETLNSWDGKSVVSRLDNLPRLYHKGVHCFDTTCLSKLKAGAIEMLLANNLLNNNGEPAEAILAWRVRGNVIRNIDLNIGHIIVSVEGAEELLESDMRLLKNVTAGLVDLSGS